MRIVYAVLAQIHAIALQHAHRAILLIRQVLQEPLDVTEH